MSFAAAPRATLLPGIEPASLRPASGASYHSAMPYSGAGVPMSPVPSLQMGGGARPYSSRPTTPGYGITPAEGYGSYYGSSRSRPRSPDEYHERVRNRSMSPTRAASNLYYPPTSPAGYGSGYGASPRFGSPAGYGRPPPSYHSSQGDLDRAKSASGDIFMLYQTRDALQNIVGHL